MALPTGPTVTFLFTDIEGSTRLERAVGSANLPDPADLAPQAVGLQEMISERGVAAPRLTDSDRLRRRNARPHAARSTNHTP